MQNCDLSSGLAKGLDHREPRLLASSIVVGYDLRDDLDTRFAARNIDGENRNSRCVGLLNDRNDRFRITRAEHDCTHLLDDEVLDLIALLGDVLIRADEDCFVITVFSFGGNAVPDDLEEWVVQRQQRNTDRSLQCCASHSGRRLRRPASQRAQQYAREHKPKSLFHDDIRIL